MLFKFLFSSLSLFKTELRKRRKRKTEEILRKYIYRKFFFILFIGPQQQYSIQKNYSKKKLTMKAQGEVKSRKFIFFFFYLCWILNKFSKGLKFLFNNKTNFCNKLFKFIDLNFFFFLSNKISLTNP